MKIRFHTQTGGVTLQAQQPEVNIIRVALQGFAAVCGGTQSPAHQRLRRGAGAADRALGPDRAAHPAGARPRVRRRRHRRPLRRLLLRRVADRRDRAALLGADGARSTSWAARSRRWSSCSARSRSRRLSYHERYKSGQDIIVGVNKYVTDQVDDVDILKVDPESEQRQLDPPEGLQGGAATRPAVDGQARGAARRRPRRRQPAAPDPRRARRRRLDRRGLRRDARRLRRVQGRRLLLERPERSLAHSAGTGQERRSGG